MYNRFEWPLRSVFCRMDLMNKELLNMTKDLASNPRVFKQDPKLVTAIDNLFRRQVASLNVENGGFILPERKLKFEEVQTLLRQAMNTVKGNNANALLNTKRIVVKAAVPFVITVLIVAEKLPEVQLIEANDARKSLIKKIEDILADINKSAESGDAPKLFLRNQRLWSNCIYDLDR